jgi:Homeodomain-like domain
MILLCGAKSSGMSKEALMRKLYVVRLADEERAQLTGIVRKFRGTSQKVRRAQILLQADADGPGWTDQQIAEAFGCRRQTVENVRQRLVERGLAQALDGVKRAQPPTPKLLDGVQEAKVIATRLGPPPRGYANWTLRLLARRVVELRIVEAVSYETLRRTLKKTTSPGARSNTG